MDSNRLILYDIYKSICNELDNNAHFFKEQDTPFDPRTYYCCIIKQIWKFCYSCYHNNFYIRYLGGQAFFDVSSYSSLSYDNIHKDKILIDFNNPKSIEELKNFLENAESDYIRKMIND